MATDDGAASPRLTHAATEAGNHVLRVVQVDGMSGMGREYVLARAAGPMPEEVSPRGARPLRVRRAGPGDALAMLFAPAAHASAYNVVGGALGSWPASRPMACAITARTDAGNGDLEIEADVPGGSWFVVTASNDQGEGPAGSDSFGGGRSLDPAWTGCGPVR